MFQSTETLISEIEKMEKIIDQDVSIDTNSRFVSANEATLNIGKGCKIGPYSIFNCGEDIIIGEDSIFGVIIFKVQIMELKKEK